MSPMLFGLLVHFTEPLLLKIVALLELIDLFLDKLCQGVDLLGAHQSLPEVAIHRDG